MHPRRYSRLCGSPFAWGLTVKHEVLYVATDDGGTLPVIDVTHPAFAVSTSDAELAILSEQFVQGSKRRQEMLPALRDALKSSLLGRGLLAASKSVLSGISTYLLKLGPDNLGAGAQPIDRSIAESFPVLTVRIRLQDMARLLADGLKPCLAAHPERPLLLVNIGGGPAADSWNALISLHHEPFDLPAGWETVIAVLDVDEAGPAFGARAIAALRVLSAPLERLEIGLRYIRYDWGHAECLREALDQLEAGRATCAISSEGALFEYGSDTEIITNLEALHFGTAPDARVVGSVTRDGEPVRCSQTAHGVASRPRTMEAFGRLVERAGWGMERIIERPFSYHVRLVKN